MVDTQELENFVLEKRYIPPTLVELLLQEATERIADLSEQVVIRHPYIERWIVPLNIWPEQAEEQQLRGVVEKYDNTTHQFAVANIFLGDMLFRNLGVTRHGRVVSYDYDEIYYMMEVNFCDTPLPHYPENELVSELQHSISSGDVSLEKLHRWLCADPCVGPLFEEMHTDLFHVDYWRTL